MECYRCGTDRPVPLRPLRPEPRRALHTRRGVESPPETVFRWLCQRKVAPYSYDWIGNPGRRSPRSLTPEVDRLEPGQEFLVFWLVEFEQNRHITGVVLPRAKRVFGRLAIS
jgi:hypothetical protein